MITVLSVVASSPAATAAPAGSTFNPGSSSATANFFNADAMTVAEIPGFPRREGGRRPAPTAFALPDQHRARLANPSRCPNALSQRRTSPPHRRSTTLPKPVKSVPGAPRDPPERDEPYYDVEPTTGSTRSPWVWMPDGAPCDTQYYGLVNQLYSAASQFNVLRTRSLHLVSPIGRDTSNVRYHPELCLGSSPWSSRTGPRPPSTHYTHSQPNSRRIATFYGLVRLLQFLREPELLALWWD